MPRAITASTGAGGNDLPAPDETIVPLAVPPADTFSVAPGNSKGGDAAGVDTVETTAVHGGGNRVAGKRNELGTCCSRWRRWLCHRCKYAGDDAKVHLGADSQTAGRHHLNTAIVQHGAAGDAQPSSPRDLCAAATAERKLPLGVGRRAANLTHLLRQDYAL
jgi:hypothetical protein